MCHNEKVTSRNSGKGQTWNKYNEKFQEIKSKEIMAAMLTSENLQGRDSIATRPWFVKRVRISKVGKPCGEYAEHHYERVGRHVIDVKVRPIRIGRFAILSIKKARI